MGKPATKAKRASKKARHRKKMAKLAAKRTRRLERKAATAQGHAPQGANAMKHEQEPGLNPAEQNLDSVEEGTELTETAEGLEEQEQTAGEPLTEETEQVAEPISETAITEPGGQIPAQAAAETTDEAPISEPGANDDLS